MPLPSVLSNMKEVSRFFKNDIANKKFNPNPIVQFDDEARELYQYIDQNNWHAARLARYQPSGEAVILLI